ncbi:mitochondrial large subunit ribosomal protein-domain-containing protein [Xylaria castorea]|nr:mitochondrial large subunit ribosomal protein-domain-containing protein [Xylaria castorea]
MFFRSLRPLTARATRLATTSTRSNTFLRPVCVRMVATKADAPASEPATEPATTPTVAEPKAPRQLSYFVGRNNTNNLSVYNKKKRGGNYLLTMLKGGNGDLQALRQDLQEALQLPEGDVTINNRTRHIEIRGHKRDEVVNFLNTTGF